MAVLQKRRKKKIFLRSVIFILTHSDFLFYLCISFHFLLLRRPPNAQTLVLTAASRIPPVSGSFVCSLIEVSMSEKR